MNQKRLTIASLIATISLALPISIAAQNPPASTYSPGFWQPIARVDLKRPTAIKLINETNVTIDYDLTNNIKPSPQKVSPGKSAELKGFPVPAYILINPSNANATANAPSFNLHYDVSVDRDNTIVVKIQTVDGNTPGDTTINLNETGAVYIY